MLNCQGFKRWLINQDSADEIAFRQVKDHIQDCHTCEALYQTDMTLDAMLKKGMQTTLPLVSGRLGRHAHGLKP